MTGIVPNNEKTHGVCTLCQMAFELKLDRYGNIVGYRPIGWHPWPPVAPKLLCVHWKES